MRTAVLASTLLLALAGSCPAAEADKPKAAPVLQLSDDIIRQAVRETLAEQPAGQPLPATATLSARRAEAFARQVEDATVPGCLRSDGLKLQPTGIGPFSLGGLLALPFVAVAKIRGKCQ
jgi:hypothetical protein